MRKACRKPRQDESEASCDKSPSCECKEKVLEGIKSATPVNRQMGRKQNSLTIDMEKLLVIWIEDQTSHDLHLS